MHAIILAGGLGKRLQSAVSDVPKPMAPIGDKPFLAYLLNYLAAQGITRVTLSVCYMWQVIETYFQSSYAGIAIDYVVEERPLGTGGAIANALRHIDSAKPIFVLNGDTFVKIDYQQMLSRYTSNTRMMMGLSFVSDCSRYGKVIVKDGLVCELLEKGESGPGFINAGVYLLDPAIFEALELPAVFSFECDFLPRYLAEIRPVAQVIDAYFVDIGMPEVYAKLEMDFCL